MPKFRLAVLTALAVFVAGAAAYAATNRYSIHASVSPGKAGTPRKPVPVSVAFTVSIEEAAGLRSAAVKTVEVSIPDGVVNQKAFPQCSAPKLAAAGPGACPAGSQIGSGAASAVAGTTADPASQDLTCNLTGKLFNGAPGHALLYASGAPPACAIPITAVINGTITKAGKAYKVKLTIPDSLLHPLDGVTAAIKSLSGKVDKRVKTVKGKKVALIASTACPGGKHTVTGTATTEDGSTQTVTTTVPCSG